MQKNFTIFSSSDISSIDSISNSDGGSISIEERALIVLIKRLNFPHNNDSKKT